MQGRQTVSDYRLHYMDRSGKFIRADRIDSASDGDAIDAAFERRLPVRSELWNDGRLVAKFPPNRSTERVDRRRLEALSA